MASHVGEKFGRLTVLREYKSRFSSGKPCYRLECLCDCGKITNPLREKVTGGSTRSCGCLRNEMCGDRHRKEYGEAGFNRVYNQYQISAKRRNIEFNLSREDFLSIITKPCSYCGNELTNSCELKSQNGAFRYTGIDRLDNNIGYTIENSIPCCATCNRIKMDRDINDLLPHLKKMIIGMEQYVRTA